MPHALVSVRRRVPAEQRDAYWAGWQRVGVAAADAGVHAWVFRAADEPELYLEFLEWSGADPLRPEVQDALAALGRAFPGLEERWQELAP